MGDDRQEVCWMKRFCLRPFCLWAQALRVHIFSASLVPVFLGTAVAQAERPISILRFALVVVGVLCYHGGANLVNDLYDLEADRLNQEASLFNGGSGVLSSRFTSTAQVRRVAVLCYTVGTICAFVLALNGGGFGVLLLALAGFGCGYFYSAPPLRLAASGYGEVCVGLAFGPFLVVGTAAALTGSFLPNALLVSLPVGALIAAVILLNEFPDYDSDRRSGKRTLVVRLGRKRSLWVLAALLTTAFVLLLICLTLLGLKWLVICPLWTAPLAVWVWCRARRNLEQTRQLVSACAGMIFLHLANGLTLLIALLYVGKQV
jgi:1,4-dihydroxy-2-naphthoate octaprenyltransferase